MLNRKLEAWGVFLFFITTLANTSFNIISGEKKNILNVVCILFILSIRETPLKNSPFYFQSNV